MTCWHDSYERGIIIPNINGERTVYQYITLSSSYYGMNSSCINFGWGFLLEVDVLDYQQGQISLIILPVLSV
jgi:hypothetical protein